MPRGFTIGPLAASDLDELEPLWNALREHHAELAPEWGEPRPREASWAIKRADFARWLAEDGNFCLVARADDDATAIGCAVVKLHGPESIWPTERSGELETLSVLPDWRGAGVGAALITAARARLADDGISEMQIHVLHANADGLRFYAREGFATVVEILWGDAAAPAGG